MHQSEQFIERNYEGIMGCNSSKISKTPVEIIRLRQEVKASVKWWKRKKKECADIPNSGQRECPTDSPELQCESELICLNGSPYPSDITQRTKANEQDQVNRCQLTLREGSTGTNKSYKTYLPTKTTVSDEGNSTTESIGLPPLGGRSRMADDLTIEEIDDALDFSDEMELLTRPKTETTTPTVGHVPLIVHTAWSDFSVRQRNNLFPTKSKSRVNKFRGSGHGKPSEELSLVVKRKRPMAAKGERQRPKLTEVYDAELSMPGIIVPNPKRKQEESCLNAWMTRRLRDDY